MKWTILPLILIAVGFGLMVCSPLWKAVVTPTAVWSDEQAEQLASTGARVHQLNYARGHGQEHGAENEPGHQHHGDDIPEDEAQVQAEFEKALQEHQRAQDSLEAARNWRSLPAQLLWYCGIAGMALGAAVHYLLKTPWAARFVDE